MRAMVLPRIVSLDETVAPLIEMEWPKPHPQADEVLIRVTACGVCHTEIDEIEGRLMPRFLPIVLGHEVVGRVEEVGQGVTQASPGDRVGVGWIYASSGTTDENLSPQFQATGRDVHGAYAQYMVAKQHYFYPIPDAFADPAAAPLLCAGGIGFRALNLTGIHDGQRLGLTGFGGSAHLVLQMARHRFPRSRVYVFARNPAERKFAMTLGAHWAGDTTDRAPEQLHAIIDTTPVWKPVVEALANLVPGGRLVINAIRKEDVDKQTLLELSYHRHLWMEREIKTVANITADDLRQFLPLAAAIGLRPEVELYPLEQANRAIVELKRGRIRGAKVLIPW